MNGEYAKKFKNRTIAEIKELERQIRVAKSDIKTYDKLKKDIPDLGAICYQDHKFNPNYDRITYYAESVDNNWDDIKIRKSIEIEATSVRTIDNVTIRGTTISIGSEMSRYYSFGRKGFYENWKRLVEKQFGIKSIPIIKECFEKNPPLSNWG